MKVEVCGFMWNQRSGHSHQNQPGYGQAIPVAFWGNFVMGLWLLGLLEWI